MDWLIGPIASKTKLTPGANVLLGSTTRFRMPARALPTSVASGAKDAVELLHGDVGQRVLLTDHHTKTWLPTRHIVGSCGELNLDRVMVLVALIQLQLAERKLAPNAHVAYAKDQRRHCRFGGLHMPLNPNIRLVCPKSFLPQAADAAVSDVIRAPYPDGAANTLARRVVWQS